MGNDQLIWKGNIREIVKLDKESINILNMLNLPLYVLKNASDKVVGISKEGKLYNDNMSPTKINCAGIIPPVLPNSVGSSRFRHRFSVRYSYMVGGMSKGISSMEMIVDLAKNGYLGAFGTGGLSLGDIEQNIRKIKSHIPDLSFACSLLYNKDNEDKDMNIVKLFLKYRMSIMEVASYVQITLPLVYYRVIGLNERLEGGVIINNKVIAKVTRPEIAAKFLEPAPEALVNKLVEMNLISNRQAEISQKIPMADAITVEGESGGYTDNNNLLCTLPTIIKLKNEHEKKLNYGYKVLVGAAGGIGSPESALSILTMGADYIVTGSINQSSIESNTSNRVKEMLSKADTADMMMAPSFDNFDREIHTKVLKKGTLFPIRANKLYDLFKTYDSIEDVPENEFERIRTQIFSRPIDLIWEDVKKYYFELNKEDVIKEANINKKNKMSLIFKWYLRLSMKWAIEGENGREIDYQIWCGPSMGLFNNWVKGSFMEDYKNRSVVQIANNIIYGVAYLSRIQFLKINGANLDPYFYNYVPRKIDNNIDIGIG